MENLTPEERQLLQELLAKAGAGESPQDTSEPNGEAPEEPEGKKSVPTMVVSLATDAGAVLFHDRDEAYIHIPHDEAVETARVMSTRTKQWLRSLWYRTFKSALPSQTLADAVSTLEARALVEGNEKPVYLRIAPGPSNSIYVDLGNDAYDAVHITKDGWKVTREHGIAFLRPKGMLPLPYPRKGGSAWEQFDLINIDDNDAMTGMTLKMAVLSYEIGCFLPLASYNHLSVIGESGSGKTTQARMVKGLIDPNAADTQGPPADGKSLYIGAQTEHVQLFDNMSAIGQELSDDFCRLSTGGGLKARKLYTDGEQAILQARRPTIFTSLNPVVRENDLAQRTLTVKTTHLDQFETEADLWERFNRKSPYILGGIFDLIAGGLRELRNVETRPDLPRLADWGRFMIAVERAAGWEDNLFLDCYHRNYLDQIYSAIDADPVARAIVAIAEREGEYHATYDQLLDEISDITPERQRKERSFPSDGTRLSKRITKVLGILRIAGVEITKDRTSTARFVTLKKIKAQTHDRTGQNTVISVIASSETEYSKNIDGEGPTLDPDFQEEELPDDIY